MTRVDKQKAIKLRLQGKTYGDIQKELAPISKATLSLWLKNMVLSQETREILASRTKEKSFAAISKKRRIQANAVSKNRARIRKAAIREIGDISDRELMILAAALYWAEGYKRIRKVDGRDVPWHEISLTNADSVLVKLFLKCMVHLCGVEVSDIRAGLRLFRHINEHEAIEYWSGQLGIPKENFTKPYFGISRASMGKRPYNRLPHGTVQVRINNTDLFYKIMGWIDGLKTSIQ